MALIDREATAWVATQAGRAARRLAAIVLRRLADTLREEEPVLAGTTSVDAVDPPAPAPAVTPAPAATPEPAVTPEPAPSPEVASAASADPGLHDRVIDVLHTVYDPEIPVDIYELGLIYGVEVRDDASVHVRMTLTSPNCPAAQSLPSEVETKVSGLDGVSGAEVEVVFDPPWTPDLMSEEAKLELNIL